MKAKDILKKLPEDINEGIKYKETFLVLQNDQIALSTSNYKEALAFTKKAPTEGRPSLRRYLFQGVKV